MGKKKDLEGFRVALANEIRIYMEVKSSNLPISNNLKQIQEKQYDNSCLVVEEFDPDTRVRERLAIMDFDEFTYLLDNIQLRPKRLFEEKEVCLIRQLLLEKLGTYRSSRKEISLIEKVIDKIDDQYGFANIIV